MAREIDAAEIVAERNARLTLVLSRAEWRELYDHLWRNGNFATVTVRRSVLRIRDLVTLSAATPTDGE